jgi:Protein kinase domain
VCTSRHLHRRFTLEAQVLAKLRHPNIVPVFEAELNDGEPYFTMDYIRGGSLAARLSDFAQPAAAAALVETVARAVHYAHEQGILHRDLKPGNILLGDRGEPYVGDFGLAKLLETDDSVEVPATNAEENGRSRGTTRTLTRPGSSPGTPPYMAPEQYVGSPGAVDARTDVWALGVILYELATGRLPFDGESRATIENAVLTSEPPKPSDLAPRIERGLEAIIHKCLQKAPEARYQSAAAVADALATFRRPSRSTKWLMAAGLLLTIGLGLLAPRFFNNDQPTAVIPTEEENYRRAVQPYLDALAQGKSVELIGNNAQMIPHRWRAGGGEANVHFVGGQTGERCAYVESRGMGLLELLHSMPVGAYRIVVEMRHEKSNGGNSYLGVYIGHHQLDTMEGSQHLLTRLTFADLGDRALAYLGRRASCAELAFWLQGSTHEPPFHRTGTTPGVHRFYEPDNPDASTGPWRTLALAVRPDRVEAEWDGAVLGSLSEAKRDEWITQLRDKYKDLATADLNGSVFAGLGLWMENGTIAVRRFTIETITDNP